MTDNVISLGDRADNNRMISVEQMLEQALADLRSGEVKATGALLIFDDAGDGTKAYEVRRANMSRSQQCVILTVVQAHNVARMRGIE